ncbi:MAG: hypothetical protein GY851_09355 [bacterium]|nr:hypothetical protein [bacterium]
MYKVGDRVRWTSICAPNTATVIDTYGRIRVECDEGVMPADNRVWQVGVEELEPLAPTPDQLWAEECTRQLDERPPFVVGDRVRGLRTGREGTIKRRLAADLWMVRRADGLSVFEAETAKLERIEEPTVDEKATGIDWDELDRHVEGVDMVRKVSKMKFSEMPDLKIKFNGGDYYPEPTGTDDFVLELVFKDRTARAVRDGNAAPFPGIETHYRDPDGKWHPIPPGYHIEESAVSDDWYTDEQPTVTHTFNATLPDGRTVTCPEPGDGWACVGTSPITRIDRPEQLRDHVTHEAGRATVAELMPDGMWPLAITDFRAWERVPVEHYNVPYPLLQDDSVGEPRAEWPIGNHPRPQAWWYDRLDDGKARGER